MSIFKPARLTQLDFDGDRWVIRLPHSVKFEESLDENFYAHVAMSLKPWDEIVIRPDDMSYKAVLIVVATGRLWAKVAIERYTELKVGALPKGEEISIEWGGGNGPKYQVMRGSIVLQEGFATRPEAEKWKAEHLAEPQKRGPGRPPKAEAA